MTENQKVELLHALTGEDENKVIEFSLRFAKSAILKKAFPFLSTRPADLPDEYEPDQIEIAKYLIFKQGGEGAVAQTENGISTTYESAGIPESMLAHIVPRLKTIGG